MLSILFEAIPPGAEETYTVDVWSKEWLASGDVVNKAQSLFSTDETGIEIVSQSWDADGHLAQVRVKGITVSENAYLVTLLIVTNLRSIPASLFVRVNDVQA